ncbi:CDC50/LEM3 family protein [Kipferlia bialata]|uniref:CDC50/LEM3 family protein n=1 Tax=Kipferlia bialata TaxID=797122 RepID=A0A9K3CZ77_9EUKA|nr:CDC50/LEM3 family protein [Kipferlia bialata]|eukprot:g6651.t1
MDGRYGVPSPTQRHLDRLSVSVSDSVGGQVPGERERRVSGGLRRSGLSRHSVVQSGQQHRPEAEVLQDMLAMHEMDMMREERGREREIDMGRIDRGGRRGNPSSRLKQNNLRYFYPYPHAKAFVGCLGALSICICALFVCLLVLLPWDREVMVRYDHICDEGETGCLVPFTLETDLGTGEDYASGVYAGYRLTGYHQNYKRYLDSYSPTQLAGGDVSDAQLDADCYPMLPCEGGECTNPCGLIYRSLFTDAFTLSKVDETDSETVEVTEATLTPVVWRGTGVWWDVDYDKYSDALLEEWGDDAETTMAWMRTSASTQVDKPYRYVDRGLPAGRYVVSVDNMYDNPNGDKYFSVTNYDASRPSVGAMVVTAGLVGGIMALVAMCLWVVHSVVPPASKYHQPIGAYTSSLSPPEHPLQQHLFHNTEGGPGDGSLSVPPRRPPVSSPVVRETVPPHNPNPSPGHRGRNRGHLMPRARPQSMRILPQYYK